MIDGRSNAESKLYRLPAQRQAASCQHFAANQLRVLRSAAAYVLMQTLQLAADRTALRHAQATRLRQALLTIGVHVVRSVRRLVLHLPRSHPEQDAWRQVAHHLGAT